MSNQGKPGKSPLSFKAGGKNPSPNQCVTADGLVSLKLHPPVSQQQLHKEKIISSPCINENNNNKHVPSPTQLSILQAGISKKKSPFQVKNWISCVLTLDGRDKFTKVLQYTSRLLCWYFAGLAKKAASGTAVRSSAMDAATVSSVAGTASLLSNLVHSIDVRQQFFSALSKRFDELYKSLVTSRKAFRIGRSIIELDKLSSMGWGEYLSYMLLHPLAGGAADAGAQVKIDAKDTRNLITYETHPIPEEDGSHGEDDDEASWNEDEEKKLETPIASKLKVVSRPGRPKLLSKVSSNVGWGPSFTPTSTLTRTASEMKSPISPSVSTPSWKLLGGTVKLLGLMGFWAFDNISFLTGSGFLDPICGVDKAVVLVDPKALCRPRRKAHATEWAVRCYFIGSIGGFYYNLRALWEHRNNKFKEACNRLREATNSSEIQEAQLHLEQTKQQQFELWLALLKSCADVMVFSNNPGVDLHLKFRGKKNHEGLHCLGGLVSASTVLYANFPNAQ